MRMVARGFCRAHDAPGVITIATRADAAADDHRRLTSLVLAAQLQHQTDCVSIDGRDPVARVAELLAPVGAGAPGRTFENEPGNRSPGDADVALIVAPERIPAALVLQQVERRKVWQLQALLEDKGGFNAAVGQEQGAGLLLRQRLVICGHADLLASMLGC